MSSTEKTTKPVQIDRALAFNLDYLAQLLGLSSPNEVLKLFMRPIVETAIRSRAKKLSVETLRSGSEPSVLFLFKVSEKWIVSLEDLEKRAKRFRKESGLE
jgi:hypothetical protein